MKTNQTQQTIQNYKTQLKKINNQLNQINSKHQTIFNTQIETQTQNEQNLKKIKAIIVMDNPGEQEKLQKQYLVGQAGKQFNKELNSIGLQRTEVLVFNKSSITTPSTQNLNQLYKNEQEKKIFITEQHTTFETIKTLSNQLNIPILIHGYSNYLKNNNPLIKNEKSNRPLYIFFQNLYNNQSELKSKTHFYKHSSYGNLAKQIKQHCQTLKKENLTFQEYLELGKLNTKGFFE